MLYVYELTATGEIIEVIQTVDEMLACKQEDGSFNLPQGNAVRRMDVEHGGFHNVASANWPMASEAAGVMPHQIKENVEYMRQRGVPTDFTRDGKMIFTSHDHRKRALKAIGMHDKQAFC